MSSLSLFTLVTCVTSIFGLISIVGPLYIPLLLILKCVGIDYYTIRNDEEKVRIVVKKLRRTTHCTRILFQYGNFFPSGSFIGKNCFGYYMYSESRAFGNSGEVHIFTGKTTFLKLIEDEEETLSLYSDVKPSSSDSLPLSSVLGSPLVSPILSPILSPIVSPIPSPLLSQQKQTFPKQKEHLIVFGRQGAFTNLFYSRIRLNVQGLEPKPQQVNIVDAICTTYNRKKRGVFFLHGVSGAGKSTIGILLAMRLNGSFCHSFNPTDPGDTLHLMLRDTEPSEEQPTVIVLEEVNTLIRRAHDEKILAHKSITTLVHNKSTYNVFMDDLILYKHVLIIMTSNESKETIDELDPCYLRPGRVDEYFAMMESL